MDYTKKILKDSLKNKTDKATKLSVYIIVVIFMPIFVMACIFYPTFIMLPIVIYILVKPKIITKNLDVALNRVDFSDFLILGNISMKKSEIYVFDSKTINQIEYSTFLMSDFYLKDRTDFKNEYLNHHIVKINASRLRKSKILVDIFDFTLMQTDRLEIFNHICKNIYLDKTYENINHAKKSYTNYLGKLSRIYEDTKVEYCSSRMQINCRYIKNLEYHLEKNPRPFIDFVMGTNYTLPICHSYNLASNKSKQAFISETEFAKILYFDILEASKHALNISNVSKYDVIERM